MTRYYFRPFKHQTIVATLHHLRCIIVREDQPGLEHVDALLRQLGADPEALPMPRKVVPHFRRSELRIKILEALKDGPMTGREVAEMVRGDLPFKLAYKRTYQALAKMKLAGAVRHEERLWMLAT